MLMLMFSCEHLLAICVLSLEKCLFRSSAPRPFFWIGFFFVVAVGLFFSCMSCLYILAVNLLFVTFFANIFSQSRGHLSILFMVSFAVQNLISDYVPFVYFLLLFRPLWETDL